MKLHYYAKDRNFGDQINEWLWERLLPGFWTGEGATFSAIGTLLGKSLPKKERVIVFSSGVGYGALPDFVSGSVEISCVRGPLSAAALGLSSSAAVTDGAALLATLEDCKPLPQARRRGVVFMPHHWVEDVEDYRTICGRVGIDYLSPRTDSRELVERLRSAELVLADAMHAAIVADALRVPWVPIASSPQINAFKWLDWTQSLALSYSPTLLGAPSVAAVIRNRALGVVGERHYFADREPEAALRHYQAQSRRHHRQRVRWLQMKGGHVLKRALCILEKKPAPSWRVDVERKLSSGVSAALQNAAKRRPFLSDDMVFSDRLRELSKRLNAIAVAEAPQSASLAKSSPKLLLMGTG